MRSLSTKKGKAKPRCFVCGSNMKAVIRTEIVCSKCGSKLQEADRDGEKVVGKCQICGKELPEPQMNLCSNCFDKNGHTPGIRITRPEEVKR